MKPIFKKILFLLIFFVILFGVYFIYSFQRFYSKTFVPHQLTTEVSANNLPITVDRPFNVLLLGYGGGNHDGAYLTDSMVLIHNDPSKKQLFLISIPRDIWVSIPTNLNKNTRWKVNAAYEIGLDDQAFPNKPAKFKGVLGASNLVKDIVGQITGLPVDRFVAMDFNGFTKTIDSLGGVDIQVEKTFDDYEYPIDGQENDLCGHQSVDLPDLEKIATISAIQAFPCRYEHLHFDMGLQHMNGETALKYVRSRHSIQDGTDFGRSKRQRNLLSAVKQKVFSINALPSILPLMDSLQNDFKTDFSLSEIQQLIPKINDLKDYSIQNIALTNQNVLVDSISSDGQQILVPKDGIDNWEKIHTWLQVSLDQSLAPSNINNISPIIKVENGTTIAGLAALAANRLSDKDFNVLMPENADNQSYGQTVIFTDGSNIDQGVLTDLKNEFGVAQIQTKSLTLENCNILIVVGKNYNLLQGKKVIN